MGYQDKRQRLFTNKLIQTKRIIYIKTNLSDHIQEKRTSSLVDLLMLHTTVRPMSI